MGLRKTIKDLVLKELFDNGGQNTKLTVLLLPYDSNRTDIKAVLFLLEKDKIIEIDKDYSRLTFRSAGRYATLGSIDLYARLTPYGETYYKEHYMTNDKGDTKIEIKNFQNISNSTVGQVNQDSDSSKSSVKITSVKDSDDHTLRNAIIGIIVTVIGGLILYYVFGIGN